MQIASSSRTEPCSPTRYPKSSVPRKKRVPPLFSAGTRAGTLSCLGGEGRGITLLWVRQAKLQAAQPSWPAPSRLNEPRPVAHRPHSPLACDGQAHLVSFVQQCTCHCRYRENRRTRSAACLSLSHLSSSHTLTAPHDSTTPFLRKEKTARPSVSLDQLHI